MTTCNIGKTERLIRAAVGMALVVLALTGTIGIWGWLGVVPLVTAANGYCPAYALFGKGAFGPDKPGGT